MACRWRQGDGDFIDEIFVSAFGAITEDQARLVSDAVNEQGARQLQRTALQSHHLSFGGDIGRLAVCGTVNVFR